MSITLPPLPPTDYRVESYPSSGNWFDAYMDGVVRDYAIRAVEADRASRVPMTDAQMGALPPYWLGADVVRQFSLIELMRAVEAHHGIGAKPAQPLMCVKCGVDRAKSPCRMPFIATTLCPFTGTTA